MTYEINLSPLASIKSVERLLIIFFIRNKRKNFVLTKQFHNIGKKKENKRERLITVLHTLSVSTLYAKETSNS